ncbi:hypothetical protein JCM16303_004197 [Sporobolomyces ruberrimus]
MRGSSTSSLALLLALPSALAGLFDSPKPLLAFSHPRSFLGLKDEFTKRVDQVAFLPGFHPCGTLTIFALDDTSSPSSLDFTDFEIFPRTSNGTESSEHGDGEAEQKKKTLMDYFDEAKDSVLEEAALEGTVLSWSKGWRTTCGKGAVNKQVKVVKVSSKDILGKPGQTREQYLEQLDGRITPHLEQLDPAPHNNLVILTPISSATQFLLFDVATPSRPNSPPTSDRPTWKIEYPVRRKREHSWLLVILAKMIDFAILAAACVGSVAAGKWVWNKYQEKKGSIRLPFTREEDEAVLDLNAE